MQINGYNSQVSQRYLEKNKSSKNQIETKAIVSGKTATANAISLNNTNSKTLINSQERDFFKSLFPENSDQIDKHIVFNRNGKVNTFSLAKGMIIDSRA